MLGLVRKELEGLRGLLGPGWEWGYLDSCRARQR